MYPDVDRPFSDISDVISRLLPYHVFHLPKEDLALLTTIGKGKGKATEDDLRVEIAGEFTLQFLRYHSDDVIETKFAVECFKRREALRERFRNVKIQSGKVSIGSSPEMPAPQLASTCTTSGPLPMTKTF